MTKKQEKQNPDLEYRELCEQIQEDWTPETGDRVWSDRFKEKFYCKGTVKTEKEVVMSLIGLRDWRLKKDFIFLPSQHQLQQMIIDAGYEPHSGYNMPDKSFYCRLVYHVDSRNPRNTEGYKTGKRIEINQNHESQRQDIAMLKAFLSIPAWKRELRRGCNE